MKKFTVDKFINLDTKMHFSKEYIKRIHVDQCSNYTFLLDNINLEKTLLQRFHNIVSEISKRLVSVDLFVPQYCTEFLNDEGNISMGELVENLDNIVLHQIEEDTLLTCLSDDKETPFLLFPVKSAVLPSLIVNSKHRMAETFLIHHIEEDDILVIDLKKYTKHLENGNISMEENHDRKFLMPKPNRGEIFHICDSTGKEIDSFTYNSYSERGNEAIIATIPNRRTEVAKIYVRPRSMNELRKLFLMLNDNIRTSMEIITGFKAWPQYLVSDEYGYVRGYVMKMIKGIPLKTLNKGEDGFREIFPDNDKLSVINILIAYLESDIIAQQNGYFKVDNNLGNFILANTIPPAIYNVDIDSAQIGNCSSQTISRTIETSRRKLISTSKDMESGLVSARMASFIDTHTVWNFLFLCSSPFTDDGRYWGDLSPEERLKENELLAATYSWFPPELRRQFALNLTPQEKTPSLIPLYLVLKQWAEYLEVLPENHDARCLIPESFNENDAQWDMHSTSTANVPIDAKQEHDGDTIIFEPIIRNQKNDEIEKKREHLNQKDKKTVALKIAKTIAIFGIIAVSFLVYLQLSW